VTQFTIHSAAGAIEVGYDVTYDAACLYKHSNQLSVIFVNFHNFFNIDVIMSSLVSTGNCKLDQDSKTADGCVHSFHTADATQLSSLVASAVCSEFATSWRKSRRV